MSKSSPRVCVFYLNKHKRDMGKRIPKINSSAQRSAHQTEKGGKRGKKNLQLSNFSAEFPSNSSSDWFSLFI
jgi:tryptophanyl-tRNA synthetase